MREPAGDDRSTPEDRPITAEITSALSRQTSYFESVTIVQDRADLSHAQKAPVRDLSTPDGGEGAECQAGEIGPDFPQLSMLAAVQRHRCEPR